MIYPPVAGKGPPGVYDPTVGFLTSERSGSLSTHDRKERKIVKIFFSKILWYTKHNLIQFDKIETINKCYIRISSEAVGV